MYVLTKKKAVVIRRSSTNNRPQFYFRTTDVTGSIELPKGVEMVMPGDNVTIDSEADHADRDGRRPAFRYPRRWPYVGAGVVAKILA